MHVYNAVNRHGNLFCRRTKLTQLQILFRGWNMVERETSANNNFEALSGLGLKPT